MADEDLPRVTVYTDGGCDPNPGTGGWAAVLIFGAKRKEISGGERETTNNRMELTAAVRALATLNRRCRVSLHTDSQYVKKGMTEWIEGWKRKGWKTATREPVKNVELWQALEAQCARHAVEWKWVKAHVGIAENERCDALAGAAIRALQRSASSK
jgi:ribonuclease HI